MNVKNNNNITTDYCANSFVQPELASDVALVTSPS